MENKARPLDLADKYMEIYFSSQKIENLRHILSDDFTFKGPLFTFKNPEDYIASLEKSPPENCSYLLTDSFQNNYSACLIYEFYKPGIQTNMVQKFDVSRGKIDKILLVFDTAHFKH